MIAHVTGILAREAARRIVIATDGGVGYEITVPLGVLERLPATGDAVHAPHRAGGAGGRLVAVRLRPAARAEVFQRLLGASGFGPRLALALLSALGARPHGAMRSRGRTSRRSSSVRGIGKKKAERLVLELQDKLG